MERGKEERDNFTVWILVNTTLQGDQSRSTVGRKVTFTEYSSRNNDTLFPRNTVFSLSIRQMPPRNTQKIPDHFSEMSGSSKLGNSDKRSKPRGVYRDLRLDGSRNKKDTRLK